MKKFFAVLFMAFLLTGQALAAAPSTTAAPGDQAPDTDIPDQSIPTSPDRPSTAPDKGISSIGGVLPGPAGDKAQNVLNTIDEFSSGEALGNALSDLLGGNSDSGNETQE